LTFSSLYHVDLSQGIERKFLIPLSSLVEMDIWDFPYNMCIHTMSNRLWLMAQSLPVFVSTLYWDTATPLCVCTVCNSFCVPATEMIAVAKNSWRAKPKTQRKG
jgi:hypothetical protein